MSRTHAHGESSTGDADRDKGLNLIAEGNRGDRPMSSTDDNDELEQRVVELEDRVDELEQLLGDETPTVETSGMDIVGTPEHDYDQLHPKDVINDIPGARDDGVDQETVLNRLDYEGFDDPERELDQLRRRGEIYNPCDGLIRVV